MITMVVFLGGVVVGMATTMGIFGLLWYWAAEVDRILSESVD